MITRTSGSRRLRLSAAFAVAGTLALTTFSTGRADTPTPSPTPSPAGPLMLRLDSVVPLAPQPHGTLTLRGAVRNVSSSTRYDIGVRLRLGDQIRSRDQLSGVDRDRSNDTVGSVVSNSTVKVRPLLRPGEQAGWTIKVKVDDLSLPSSGVYPMGIDALGADTTAGDPSVQTQMHTFLPYLAHSSDAHPMTLAWVWPLIDQPRLGGGGAFIDDVLAQEFRKGGRLNSLVAAAAAAEHQVKPTVPRVRSKSAVRTAPTVRDVPVTWAVDPALVDEAVAMTSTPTYRVDPSGQFRRGKPGSGVVVARDWIAALRSAVLREHMFALPYADVDLTALNRDGLVDDIGTARTVGNAILRRHIGNPSDFLTAWPPDGLIDQPTLEVLANQGVDTVVLAQDADPVENSPYYTVGSPARLSTLTGNINAAVTDNGLDGLIASQTDLDMGAGAAIERFLAETLMIVEEAPSIARAFAITPPRRWKPSLAYASGVLLATGRVPWIDPVPLATVVTTPPRPSVQRAGLTTSTLHKHELSGDDVGRIKDLKTRIDLLTSIITNKDSTLATQLRMRRLALESSAWRPGGADVTPLRQSLDDDVTTLYNRVRIASTGSVTLTSRSGVIPITLANDIGTQIRVGLAVQSRGSRARLEVHEPSLQTIDPGHKVTIGVRVSSQAAGRFPVDAQLLTPDGRQLGTSVEIVVTSTAYGTLAITITLGAGGALLVAVFVRLARRTWRARRAAIQ